MPLLIMLIGAALLVTGFKGTTGQLATRLSNDITGAGAPAGHGFLTWLAALVIIGSAGYITEIQRPARLFIALIIVVMLIKSDTGVIAQFFKAFGTAEQAGATPSPSLADQAAQQVGQNASGSGGGQVYQAADAGAVQVSNLSAGSAAAGINAALNAGPASGGSSASGSASGSGITTTGSGGSKASSAITGALGGAAAGAMVGGPIGAGVGGALGLISGLFK